MNKLLEIDGSDLSDIFPYLKDENCHYSEFLLIDKPYEESNVKHYKTKLQKR